MGRQYRHLTLAEREDIMVHWKNRVGVSEIARLVGRDKSTVSREIRRNGWYSPVAGRMWCYRASTAHDKSQRRARRCRRQPLLADPRRLELVARLIRESAPAPPGADRGPHHDPGAPTWGAGDTTIYRAVHSGLGDHTLGGHKKMSARSRPQEAPQEGPSRRAGQDRSPTSWASGPPSPTGAKGWARGRATPSRAV